MGRTQLQLASRKLARGCEPSYRKSYSSLVSLFSYPLSTIGEFLWDVLALVRRNDEHFINEPHVGNAPRKLRFEGKLRAQRSARRARKGPRGNPVVSSKGTSYFNDMLGTTVGAKKDGKYSAAALTAFGERLDNADGTSPAIRSLGEGWFTGKPYVEGLGHAFLMRNYRAGLAKWQTADPMGYPDGWNQLAYCNNGVTSSVDFCGAYKVGDLRIDDMFPDVLKDVVSLGIEGFKPEYDWIGFETDLVLVQKDAHKEWEWKPHQDHEDPVDVRGDKWYKLLWNHYDVILTLTKETILSKLAKLTGKVADIGGGLGMVLKGTSYYNATISVAEFISKLEKTFEDHYSVRVGYVWRLDKIDVEWMNLRRVPFGCIGPFPE